MNARLEELRSKFQENPRRYFAPFANELRKSGDLPQAISVCRAHLASQPGHVSGHIVLGQALYEAGESDEARGIFTAALELDPENLIALRSLGEIAQVNGEFTAARLWYERLLDADPRNTEVSQLLRDIPTAAVPAAIAPLPELEDIPRPDQRPEEQVVEPAPAPRFHTTFSGSGPAYKTADEESASEDRAPESAEPVSAAVDTSAEPPVETEPVTIGAPAEPADAIDLLDAEDFHAGAQPEAEVQYVPDESLEPAAFNASDEDGEVDFLNEAVYSTTAEFEEELHIPDAAPQAEHKGEQITDVEPSAEPTEPVRAFFAERGFDGPADDQIGWMTTPSAALSDLESAPEDWNDESAAAEAERSQEVAAEPSAEEPQPVEAIAPDPAVDSWFDDVEGAAVIEATVVTTDEFWLPPELSTAVQAPISTPEPEPEFVAEMPSTESVEETDVLSEPPALPVTSSFEPPAGEEVGYTERDSFEDESFTSIAAAAESTHQPDEATPSTFSEQLEPPFMESFTSAEELTVEDRVESEEELAADVPADTTAQVSMGSVAEEPIQAAAEGWTEPEGETAHEPISAAEEWTKPEGEVTHEPTYAAQDWTEPAGETPLEPIHAAEEWTEPAGETPLEPIQAASDGWTVQEPIESEGWDEPAYEAPPEPAPSMGLTPAFIDAVPNTPPAPFVTETLAELYLQQGFRDEALAIYRQLAERDPSDESLKERIAAIEKPAVVEEPPAPVASTWSDPTSQSVRTFFSRLARRPAVPVTTLSSPAPLDVSLDASPDVPFATAASALANLFAASKPPASDEGAASTLANAFTDPAGRPSRAADRELSLDHLFRDVPPAEQSGGGVSLDEFFATPNASPGSPTEPGEAGGPGEQGGTDIRQFTAWLEGLRKK